jgi:hypothetical protein
MANWSARTMPTAWCAPPMCRPCSTAGLYDDKGALKDGLLDPDCIEAREWNLSAGQYKPFDFTQLKSDKSVSRTDRCAQNHRAADIIQGLGQAAGNGGGAGMRLPETWIETTVRSVVTDSAARLRAEARRGGRRHNAPDSHAQRDGGWQDQPGGHQAHHSQRKGAGSATHLQWVTLFSTIPTARSGSAKQPSSTKRASTFSPTT